MYKRLSYLRNPRYAAQTTAPAALPLKGSSAAHRRRHGPQAGSSSTTVQPRQYGSRAVLTGAEAGFGVCPAQVIQWWGGQQRGICIWWQPYDAFMRILPLPPPSTNVFHSNCSAVAGGTV
jgi:hypothetical protein